MRYPPEQKQRTRQRLLETSSELSKTKGFSAMSVDDLMSAAGLTGGAFYAHFESKNALFSELIKSELSRVSSTLAPREDQTLEESVTRLLDIYLTYTHVRAVGTGCVLPALGPEIARADDKIKRSFEKSMNELQAAWTERLGSADLAWSTICQLVGTVTVARAMSSKAAAEKVIQASRAQIKSTLSATKPPARVKRPDPAKQRKPKELA